ncbi:helix-turn-helix domain-containing protein [Flavobacterium mesophilum]|uniref:helix-turn-helix domain-containing protein n=1 Tax=Flavobacterium mesophilum TaxID=3143495 RepID=UPI0031D5C3A4
MKKNYFSQNINYLVGKSGLSQDDFGSLLGLKRGAINNYINEKAFPKIDTLLKICDDYNISLDQLIRIPLNDNVSYLSNDVNIEHKLPAGFVMISEKHLSLLEHTIDDKNKIIKALELRLGENDKSETA